MTRRLERPGGGRQDVTEIALGLGSRTLGQRRAGRRFVAVRAASFDRHLHVGSAPPRHRQRARQLVSVRQSFGQPDSLSSHLHLISRLIQAGFGTRVYYTALPGFDTHADQLNQHTNLLAQLGAAVQQFFTELTQAKQADRVVLLTFSEFGRRVAENGSAGTDHGAGSSNFLIGPAVAGGLIGKHPSLAPDALDAGDLRHAIDFRQIYRTLAEDWLKYTGPALPAGDFEKLPLLRAKT
ncbi:MAG: DUF1501 domain-containing protein [Planctomycetaceae bacterium]|nr:DUF1501 domain-containing protein [Planctomycetaceae bacterium]